MQDRAQANPAAGRFQTGEIVLLTSSKPHPAHWGRFWTWPDHRCCIHWPDTINHRRLLVKLVMITDDVPLTKFIRTMLSNRRFKVELNGKQSRWRNQRNGRPQGSVLSPLLFNVYTNDQPLPVATNSFIYADDLCLTTQQKTFEQVETTLASGLNELGAYCNENHLRPNPAKTQLTAFHLKNHQADRKLNVTWNGTKLDHTHSPVYFGITLDRSLTYRNHCLKTRAKLSSRNNLLR